MTARAAPTSKDAGALYARALRSLYGEGVRRNRAQAARWYRRAAKQGVDTAALFLEHLPR